jgi:Leucine-rich repeat (LRR) protein
MNEISRFSDPTFLALAAKKAARFVLKHNWFADPLEVVTFQQTFDKSLQELSQKLQKENFDAGLIRPVIVPKRIKERPVRKSTRRIHEVRNLAHLEFGTQVISTAILMACADEWENKFGNLSDNKNIKGIFGNRLDCHQNKKGQNFSIGTYSLYKFWGEDYSNFVRVTSDRFNSALLNLKDQDKRLYLLSTDISSFYPSIDLKKLSEIVSATDSLNSKEKSQVKSFFNGLIHAMLKANLAGLPQGMVASGFFANIYLNKFDTDVVASITESISIKQRKPKLVYYSRYVDDIRLIIETQALAGQPARETKKHAVFKALDRLITPFNLNFSAEKSNLLEQSIDGTPLGEGLLAEKMDSLAKKAYGSLSPESVDDIASQFELLFSTDSTAERRPASGEVQRGRYRPILDGPGVRPDSRKRFAAGRWRHLFLTYKGCAPTTETRKDRFVQEIFRDWKSDPSQLRLLYYSFELSDYSEKLIKDALKFLERYNGDKTNKNFKEWLPFIHSAILRTFISQAYRGKTPTKVLLKLAVDSVDKNNPWFLRLLSWLFLAAYGIKTPKELLQKASSSETESNCQEAIKIWKFVTYPNNLENFRVLFNSTKSLGIMPTLRDDKIRQYLSSRDAKINFSELEQVFNENIKTLKELKNLEIHNNNLYRQASKLKIVVKQKIYPKTNKINSSVPVIEKEVPQKYLYEEILEGKYRSEQASLQLGINLIQAIKNLPLDEQTRKALNGDINPFNISIDGNGLNLSNYKELSGWRSVDWRQVKWIKPEQVSPVWAWPLGLILRSSLTGKLEHLYGAPASARYSLFMSFQRLNYEGAFVSESFSNFIMQLLRWPGSDIQAILDLDSAENILKSLLGKAKERSINDVQLLPIEVPLSGENRKIVTVLCQVDNGIDLKEVSKHQDVARRAVLYSLYEVENRIMIDKNIGIQITDNEVPFYVVVLPELFVPDSSIGDIHRFVKKNKVAVLFGRYFWESSPKKLHNSLYWVFPSFSSSGPATFSIRQDKFSPTTEEINAGIVGANPKIVWRIAFGNNKRICALNCYEVTDPNVKALLSGRTEAVFVSAYNDDVATFDTTIQNYSYEIFGFVGLANNANKGGSCIYAPYRGGPHAKQLVHKHGEKQFLISLRKIDLEDFRNSNGSEIKTPPSGFTIKD